ncbi:MAG TPA: DUF1501 domain-containing protein, partial [Gemmataceae bacterium]|nr:DUF1501 domain-containing protein [Gemmataceae bacterium]
MLSLFGQKNRFCDGITRRSFLRIGAFGMAATGFTLADVMRAQPAEKTGTGSASIINIFLGGGPPHQDMWDIKTEAPKEIRGEFQPIATSVPSIQIGEVFPQIAARMHKFTAIRSVVGCTGDHDAFQCNTGWQKRSLSTIGGRPSVGSVVAKLQGPVDPSVPPFVALANHTGHMPWSDGGKPGFLGPSYAPFKPDGPGLSNLHLNGISREQLADRERLLSSFDTMR